MERLPEQTDPRPAPSAGHPQPWAAQPAGTPPPAGAPGPEPERPKWSTRRTGVVTAVAAAAVLAVGGIAVAYSGSDANGDTATTQGPGGQGGGFPGGFPGGAGQAGLATALHGTFVTRAADGSYVTQVMQTGEVTAVDATSIAVRSADGYAKTYTLSGSTTVNGGQAQLDAVETGHTVTVVASGTGAAATILDQSLLTGGQGGFPGQGGTGQLPPAGGPGDGTT